jgi:alpha(1,3/1,4) fucosyltransferase
MIRLAIQTKIFLLLFVCCIETYYLINQNKQNVYCSTDQSQNNPAINPQQNLSDTNDSHQDFNTTNRTQEIPNNNNNPSNTNQNSNNSQISSNNITVKPKIIATYMRNYNENFPWFIKIVLDEKYDVKVLPLSEAGDNYDVISDSIWGNRGVPITSLIQNQKAVKIFYTGEAWLPSDISVYDLVLAFNFIDSPNYVRFPFYNWRYNITPEINNRGTLDLSHKKYFACFLHSDCNEGYHWNGNRFDGVVARDHTFQILSKYKEVKSGGQCFNNIGKNIEEKDTKSWLSNCKFVITGENTSFNGYITEKVFNAYVAGAIPIYFGDKSVINDLNKKAIVWIPDYDDDSLVEYIKKLDQNDTLYTEKWNEPIITNTDVYIDSVREKMKKVLFPAIEKRLQEKN